MAEDIKIDLPEIDLSDIDIDIPDIELDKTFKFKK